VLQYSSHCADLERYAPAGAVLPGIVLIN